MGDGGEISVAQRPAVPPPAAVAPVTTPETAPDRQALSNSAATRTAAAAPPPPPSPLGNAATTALATPGAEAIEKAEKIYDAFHGHLFYEEEQVALDQIRRQPLALLFEIVTAYESRRGVASLMRDFREYADLGEYKEALTILMPVLTLEQKLRLNIGDLRGAGAIFGGVIGYHVGRKFRTENEQGMLAVLQSATAAERKQAWPRIEGLLRESLNDDQFYEARKLCQPDMLYEIVKERQNAPGWFDDDEAGRSPPSSSCSRPNGCGCGRRSRGSSSSSTTTSAPT